MWNVPPYSIPTSLPSPCCHLFPLHIQNPFSTNLCGVATLYLSWRKPFHAGGLPELWVGGYPQGTDAFPHAVESSKKAPSIGWAIPEPSRNGVFNLAAILRLPLHLTVITVLGSYLSPRTSPLFLKAWQGLHFQPHFSFMSNSSQGGTITPGKNKTNSHGANIRSPQPPWWSPESKSCPKTRRKILVQISRGVSFCF